MLQSSCCTSSNETFVTGKLHFKKSGNKEFIFFFRLKLPCPMMIMVVTWPVCRIWSRNTSLSKLTLPLMRCVFLSIIHCRNSLLCGLESWTLKVAFHVMVLSFRTVLQICKLRRSTLPKLAILMPTLCRINHVKLLIVMTSELNCPCLVVNLNALILCAAFCGGKILHYLISLLKFTRKGVSLIHYRYIGVSLRAGHWANWTAVNTTLSGCFIDILYSTVAVS